MMFRANFDHQIRIASLGASVRLVHLSALGHGPRRCCHQLRKLHQLRRSSVTTLDPNCGSHISWQRPRRRQQCRSVVSQTVYKAPASGFLSKLPESWVPYAELVRWDKPAGTYYLFFPCLFSTLMAAPMVPGMASPIAIVGTSLLFFSGALIMRGAGCTINDLWDRNLDPHVSRTRLRPIARGAITPFRGLVFTGLQLLGGLVVLLQFPLPCLFYGVPSLLFVASYPLMKRVTYYPQFVLGLTFSWGAIMGFPALGIDLLSNMPALTAAACLYSSNVAWTVLYDMIYAHMDIKDDAQAGIKSIALKHHRETKIVLTGLAAVQIGLLAAAGTAAGAGPAFFIGSCGGAAVTLGVMIKRVNLKSVKDCWWWFANGCWITGGVISLGLAADYIVRLTVHDNKSLRDPDDPDERLGRSQGHTQDQ